MWPLLASLAFGQAEPPPTDHTLIYYNARLALREDQPTEAVKLWLLRNALEDQTRRVSPHDADFHSVTWAALGDLGVCQDGHPRDDEGAGIWPVALYNWVVINRSRRPPKKRPRVFDAFQLDIQQRFFTIGDVLSAKELESVRLYRGRCTRPRLALASATGTVTAKLADRKASVALLKSLLEQARDSMDPDLVRGRSAVEARLFDVHLVQAEIAAAEARAKARERGREGRAIGMSRESVDTLRRDAETTTLDPNSDAGQILASCVDWSTDEWMALSPDRRLFLFDQARLAGGDEDALDRVALGVLDRLIAAGDGAEADRWIAHRRTEVEARPAIWDGDRGRALLALDDDSGFSERSVIALHRGVRQLEGGDLPGALRSMAYALSWSYESRDSDAVHALSLRWLTYIASQFEITDDLLITLQELVPRREYSLILEDLMWGAALRADQTSFERGVRNQPGRGALERRFALLAPLARGDVRGFSRGIRDGLRANPSEILRFLDQWVSRLELEDADVRTAQTPTLQAIRELLGPYAADPASGRQGRRATELLERTQAILEGVDRLDDPDSRDRARSLDPTGEVYAGSIRLAPSDPLPWPFRASDIAAPSVYETFDLTPVEWRGDDGEWVFGWTLQG